MTFTAMKPRNNIEISRLNDYIYDDDFAFERKYDGHRIVLLFDRTGLNVFNREGQHSQHRYQLVPRADMQRILLFTLSTRTHLRVDAEYVDSHIVLFDMLVSDDTSRAFHLRRTALEHLYSTILKNFDTVSLSDIAYTTEEKLSLALRVRDEQGEGLVIKKLTSPYVQKRSDNIIKCKYYKTVDAIVHSVHDDRNSVQLAVYAENEVKKIGRCSIHNAKENLSVGDVVEVRYRYFSTNKRLVEPVFLRRRDDKELQDCLFDQLV